MDIRNGEFAGILRTKCRVVNVVASGTQCEVQEVGLISGEYDLLINQNRVVDILHFKVLEGLLKVV